VSDGHNRLLKLQKETEAHGVNMVFDRARFDSLADPSNKSRAVSAFNLFQTPEAIADRMAALLMPSLSAVSTVLEPSAGLGRIYSALRRAGHTGPVVLADSSVDCCGELFRITEDDATATIKQGDFLDMSMMVDAVMMNPPFKMGRDIKHILHAFKCLKPGGLLISLCYNGVKQNKQLKPIANSWDILPAGSFKKEGTNAEIVLLTMKKGI
jgi:hypothetical protein